jgi:hypothetical protein
MSTRIEVERTDAKSVHRNSVRNSALLSIWVWIACAFFMYATALDSWFLSFAVLGSAVFCLRTEIARGVFIVVAALPLFALISWLRGPTLSTATLALGFGGMIVLTYCAARGNRVDRLNLRIAVGLAIFVCLTGIVNYGIARLIPSRFDALLLKLDCGVGMTLYHWTLRSPVRITVVGALYLALPLSVAIVLAYTTWQARTHLLRALCLAALLAVPCYVLLPAVGPAHLTEPLAARNCMPSLHFTWAALLWLNARPIWLRRFAFCFMWLTAFVTLATGEHYVLDLVAAVPFTWAIQTLSRPAAS